MEHTQEGIPSHLIAKVHEPSIYIAKYLSISIKQKNKKNKRDKQKMKLWVLKSTLYIFIMYVFHTPKVEAGEHHTTTFNFLSLKKATHG